jgi:hypothetical protein
MICEEINNLRRFVLCCTGRPEALKPSVPDVIRHTALRSSDFPPPPDGLRRGRQRSSSRLQEFKEAVKIALQSLWANKLRSVLTLLGVVIGVASVIAVVTLVNGANTYVTTKVFELRRGCLHRLEDAADHHQPQRIISGFRSARTSSFPTSNMSENCKRCVGIGAQQAVTWKIVRGTQSADSSIRGYTWQMPSLQNLNIMQGRGLYRGR